ncbi:MAG TPA: type II CAAX endopeptidase family protein [Polyangiaceae bacterium]|nr:type II CAAX endopeptidase family protein [Polyangiaceae bacterium]
MEASPGPTQLGEGASANKLWASPIATLPLWPVLLVSGILFFIIAPSVPVLAGHWRGIEILAAPGVALVWWWLSARRRGFAVSDVLGQRPSRQHLSLILVSTLAALGLHFGWLSLLSALDFLPEVPAEGLPTFVTASRPIQLASLVVVSPCAEEFLFRGLIFRRSLRWMRPIPAALWSSLLFGFGHFDPVGSGLFGLVMVGLYLRTGSLWVPIAAHSLNNAFLFCLLGRELSEQVDSALIWVIAALQLVCVPWVAWFLFRMLRELRELQGAGNVSG